MVAESKLRKQIADTCLQLEEQGLLLRSWGSVSARLNEQEMIITPTGIAYKDLTPDKMVKVNVHTLSFSGSRRPSSEVQIHASIYREDRGRSDRSLPSGLFVLCQCHCTKIPALYERWE